MTTDSRSRLAGTFEVSGWDSRDYDSADGVAFARVTMNKLYVGALEGTGTTTVLTVNGPGGPAAYVALERFTGTLDGAAGSAVLRHSVAESPATAILVPTAGQGVFAGRQGVLTIELDAQGTHHYTLD
jgi:hypothetical protein